MEEEKIILLEVKNAKTTILINNRGDNIEYRFRKTHKNYS